MSDFLFLKACRGEITDTKPVWMMRQAGRYLPEYLELRNTFPDFLSFVYNARAAAQATVQPIQRFGLDAAILFSDILVALVPLGISLQFIPGKGPQIETPIRTPDAVKNLKDVNWEKDFYFTKQAIEETLTLLQNRAPLLGFVGGPLTLASYAIEGKTSKDLSETKKLFYAAPETYQTLLEKIAETVGEYLKKQADWGADALVIMDSWAGHLSKEDYVQMAFPFTKRVAEIAAKSGKPILHYANGACHLLSEFLKLPVSGFGLDWRSSLSETLEKYPHAIFQGNLDPAYLFAPTATIQKKTREILNLVQKRPHIMNLGHGVLPGTPIEGVQAFIDTVREHA